MSELNNYGVFTQWNTTQPQKKKILPFATVWMKLEIIMLSEISQSEKDKYHMIHSYVESNEQTELTELTSNTETDP